MYVARAQKKAERENELKAKYDKLKQERIQRYQGVNLYVKNLDDSIDSDALRDAFKQFGTITSAKVITDFDEEGKEIKKKVDKVILLFWDFQKFTFIKKRFFARSAKKSNFDQCYCLKLFFIKCVGCGTKRCC